jgi:hypothetical protein
MHLASPCPSSPPPLVLSSVEEGEDGDRGEGEGEGDGEAEDLGEEDWRARSIVAEESSSGGVGLSATLFALSFPTTCGGAGLEEGDEGSVVLDLLREEVLLDLLFVEVGGVLLSSIG